MTGRELEGKVRKAVDDVLAEHDSRYSLKDKSVGDQTNSSLIGGSTVFSLVEEKKEKEKSKPQPVPEREKNEGLTDSSVSLREKEEIEEKSGEDVVGAAQNSSTEQLGPGERRWLQFVENNEEELTVPEIAERLGLHETSIYRYRAKHQDRIVEIAKKIAKRAAIAMIRQLIKNAKSGETAATVKILEIGRVYIPYSAQKIEGEERGGVIILPARKSDPRGGNGSQKDDPGD